VPRNEPRGLWCGLHIGLCPEAFALYCYMMARNTMIGTLAVDGWDVTFGTASRDWAGPNVTAEVADKRQTDRQ